MQYHYGVSPLAHQRKSSLEFVLEQIYVVDHFLDIAAFGRSDFRCHDELTRADFFFK